MEFFDPSQQFAGGRFFIPFIIGSVQIHLQGIQVFHECMQNWVRLCGLSEFLITLGPKAGIPISKGLLQFAVEYLYPHLQHNWLLVILTSSKCL
jgi:hypothetical protein